jgi:signal transduction protein with GAF and PtsI domain
LLEAGLALGAELSLPVALQRIVELAAELAGARYGVLIDDARPLRLHDIADDPRSVGFPSSHPPMRSFLGVPVTARGRVYGNLYLTEKRGAEDFDADDERALVLLAAQAGGRSRTPTCTRRPRTAPSGWRRFRAITTAILAGVDTAELLALVVRHARALAGTDLPPWPSRPEKGASGSRPPTGCSPTSSRAPRSRSRGR